MDDYICLAGCFMMHLRITIGHPYCICFAQVKAEMVQLTADLRAAEKGEDRAEAIANDMKALNAVAGAASADSTGGPLADALSAIGTEVKVD